MWDVSRTGEPDAPKPKDPQALHDHGNFVTGVAWDPVGSLLATQSNDRSIRVYNRPVPQWTVPRLRADAKSKQVMQAALPPIGAPPSGWEHVPYMGMRLHAKNGRSKPFSSVASVRKVPLSGMQPWSENSSSDAGAQTENKDAAAGVADGSAPQTIGPRGFVFMDERVPSYFRRLDWSADGSLLIAPAGQDPRSHRDDPVPTTNVFLRDQWDGPVMQLGGLASASLVVRANPVLFNAAGSVQLAGAPAAADSTKPSTAAAAAAPGSSTSPASAAVPASAAAPAVPAAAGSSAAAGSGTAARPAAPQTVPGAGSTSNAGSTHTQVAGQGKLHTDDVTPFDFPFRSVFAVATLESVFVYDTEHTVPVAAAANHHFEKITDMAWSRDGKLLLVASIDGSVSLMSFSQNEGPSTTSRGGNELGVPLPFTQLPDHLQLRPTPCTAAETRWLLAVRAHEQAKRMPKGGSRPPGSSASGVGKQTARAAPAGAAAAASPASASAVAAPAAGGSAKRIQPQLVSPTAAASSSATGEAKSASAEGGVKRKRVTPTLVSAGDVPSTAAATGDAASSAPARESVSGGTEGAPAPAANKARRITPTFVSS